MGCFVKRTEFDDRAVVLDKSCVAGSPPVDHTDFVRSSLAIASPIGRQLWCWIDEGVAITKELDVYVAAALVCRLGYPLTKTVVCVMRVEANIERGRRAARDYVSGFVVDRQAHDLKVRRVEMLIAGIESSVIEFGQDAKEPGDGVVSIVGVGNVSCCPLKVRVADREPRRPILISSPKALFEVWFTNKTRVRN